jgi:hypothetical protein
VQDISPGLIVKTCRLLAVICTAVLVVTARLPGGLDLSRVLVDLGRGTTPDEHENGDVPDEER